MRKKSRRADRVLSSGLRGEEKTRRTRARTGVRVLSIGTMVILGTKKATMKGKFLIRSGGGERGKTILRGFYTTLIEDRKTPILLKKRRYSGLGRAKKKDRGCKRRPGAVFNGTDLGGTKLRRGREGLSLKEKGLGRTIFRGGKGEKSGENDVSRHVLDPIAQLKGIRHFFC